MQIKSKFEKITLHRNHESNLYRLHEVLHRIVREEVQKLDQQSKDRDHKDVHNSTGFMLNEIFHNRMNDSGILTSSGML